MTGMRSRNINLMIHRKMSRWLESLPEELREQAKKDVIVTGGCIASMLLGEEVNDFDVYFKTKDTVVKIANHYIDLFIKNRAEKVKQGGIAYDVKLEELTDSIKRERVRIKIQSAGVAGETQKMDYEYFEMREADGAASAYVEEAFDQDTGSDPEEPGRQPYRPVFMSSNAITLSDNVQIIVRFWGDHEEIHKNFDFVHCTNWWTFKDGVVLNQPALEALMSRTLIYMGSLYPICSVFRAKKFLLRGWNINAGQYLKMCLQIGQLDLTSRFILEEQLTGVDAAYFGELLAKAENKEDPNKVDTAYLVEIINRMF